MEAENYVIDKKKLLKSFDRSIARSKQVINTRFGNEQAGSLISKSRNEYETIIPDIPFIGHKNPLLIFLLPASRCLAIYRVLRREGLPLEEAGQIIFQMNESEVNSIPNLLRRVIGYLWFSPLLTRRFKKRAKESQERKCPGGYVLTFIEGDGATFDYGIDYTECAACNFLKQQGAPELASFTCAFDKTVSEILGWGLTRTMTIADGRAKCDFRFKKGGRTDINISPSVKEACKL